MKRPDRLGFADFPIDDSVAILESDAPEEYKREAVSSIGRKRDPELRPLLFKYVKDKNPEIAIQALRGLLVFKKDPSTLEELKSLCNHPNEIIRDVVQWEIHGVNETTDTCHSSSWMPIRNVVVHGNALRVLKHVPDNSIHLTFTSPPYYNARDYSIYQSYNEYLDLLEKIFREVHRITKTGRFFVLNTSPIIIPRAGRKYSSRRYPVPFDIHNRLVEIGWEFIDDIIWAKPTESSKNRVAGFEVNRKPLTYKSNPRTEYVMVYRKRTHKLIDWNLKQYARDILEESKVDDDFERSNVWNIAPATDKVHSAVFPIKLCDQVVKLYSFVGDLLLDPFAGSGTLGRSAINNKRNVFLIEVNESYVSRIKENLLTYPLLDPVKPKFVCYDEFEQLVRES